MRAMVAQRVDAWLGAPAPAMRLAVLRLVAMGFATGYLVLRLPAFLRLSDLSPDRFEPVGVMAWVREPLPGALWTTLVVVTIATGILATAGARFWATGPAFALLLLVTTTYRSSWGQLLWFEALMVLHVIIVGMAPSAAVLALDARRRRSPSPADDPTFGFPVRLAALVTVLTYVLAGVAKLRIGGADWVAGDTLRNHVAYSAARLDVLGEAPSPLARPFVAARWVGSPLAVAAVAIELSAPLALLGGRLRTAWVAGAWAMHAAIAGLMFVVFPYPLLLAAFAPLYPLERLVPRRGRRVSFTPSPPRGGGQARTGPAPAPR